MPAGEIVVRLNLNKDGYSAGMTKARKEAAQLGDSFKTLQGHTITSMQASSAAIRGLDMSSNIRAAERFISLMPAVGKVLLAAFPVFGAAAVVGVFKNIGEEVYKAVNNLRQIRNVANESFNTLIEGSQKSADSLRVTNDKLEQQIAELEHKPVNNMALALDEARVRADELATSLNKDYEQFKKIIEETQKGVLSKVLNKGVDSQLGDSMNNQLANIRTLARQQRDAQKIGDEDSATDLGTKLRAAQNAALAFADSEQTARKGLANAPQASLNAADIASGGMYGFASKAASMRAADQGQNLDAIGAFKDLVSGQEDNADEQTRNTSDQGTVRKLEADKKRAEAEKQAQELIVKQWRKDFDEAKAENDMTLAQDAQFWVQRIESARKGSDSYAAALDEANKLIAEIRGQNMRGGKEFDKTSAASYLPDAGDLTRGDTGDLKEQGRDTAAYVKSLNDQISAQRQAANAIAEQSLAMQVATGQMSKLDAAQALAAIHTQDYARAQERLQTALANASLIPGMAGQAAVAGLTAQGAQMAGQRAMQVAQDQQNVSGNTVAGAQMDALRQMVQSWTDMAQNLKTVIPRLVEGLNSDLARLITGQGKKGDVGHTLKQAGEGLVKTGLQGAEGYALKALHLGGKGAKPDGTKNNRWYVSALIEGAGGSPAGGASGGVPLPSGIAGSALGHIPGLDSSAWGGLLTPFLPHFATGGDILANHPALIGENGPELFTPSSAGTITPNHQLGGGDTHNWHIDARGSNDPAAIEAAVRRAAPGIVAASLQASHSSSKRNPGR